MLKIIFVIIILYIIIQNLLDDSNTNPNKDITVATTNSNNNCQNISKKLEPSIISNNQNNIKQNNYSESKNIIFDKPNPWTRIMYNQNDEYPYYFCIKLKISSLNDYENWKKIIPNLNFNSNTGELIIPSKDEPSALALINLISNNLIGKISLKEILEKNLIQISISKATNYEVVQNKLRDQINETVYGKTTMNPNYENDLVYADGIKSAKIDFINNNSNIDKNNSNIDKNNSNIDKNNCNINKNNSNIDDNNDDNNDNNHMLPTSQSFTNNNYQNFDNDDKDNIEPFEGSDYSYL